MILFENQVAALRLQYREPWSKRHELTLCAVQLQIYSFAIRTDPSRAASPEREVNISCDEIRGKATAVLVELAKHASTETESVYNWPVFPKLHLGRSIAIGIYLAATTPDDLTRITLLQACKEIVEMIAGYIQYLKEHAARVTKHFAAGIRTIEAQGLGWFQAVETADTKPPIRARMSANIPYQIIWWAKHSSRIVPEPEHVASVPFSVAQITPPTRQPDLPGHAQLAPQLPSSGFEDGVNSSFFDFMNDIDFNFDFTDINLDWQSLTGEFLQTHST